MPVNHVDSLMSELSGNIVPTQLPSSKSCETKLFVITGSELNKQDQAVTSEALARRAVTPKRRKSLPKSPKSPKTPKSSSLRVSVSARPAVTLEQALQKYKSLMQTPDAEYVMGELSQEELDLLCKKARIPKSDCKKSNKAIFFNLIRKL